MTFKEAISRHQRVLKARGLSLESQANYTGTIYRLHKLTGDAWPIAVAVAATFTAALVWHVMPGPVVDTPAVVLDPALASVVEE